ncbi:MAG: flagellar basal body L-ring protein FlgH [Desulfatitalea sp.]|nr:flagellar basal body L-ring protein FlgH [Desulfatitalea sp.]MBI5896466.1 flagellar basal body L-ring protein FlgH [Desulfobacterales bacterium]
MAGWAGALTLCALMWSCAASSTSVPATQPPRPVQAAPSAEVSEPPRYVASAATDGSLWRERSELAELFVNPKARRVGDILTIKIVENSSATNKASTNTDRSSSMSAGMEAFFNLEKNYPADQPFFNPFSAVRGSIDSQFEGAGATQRSGALSAYMTAQVVEVLPNGNLIIEGNREVRVNAENQMITLTGMVRPRDITSDNVIQSTYIADARIAYSGTGVLNDRQRPGWFTRIMDKVWPF